MDEVPKVESILTVVSITIISLVIEKSIIKLR